jgi:hypothetical protein
MAFGRLWGLIACHGYGNHGLRVSFPVRQMLRLVSDSVSRNIERLSYASRLHQRKLVRRFLLIDYRPLELSVLRPLLLIDLYCSYRRESYRLYCFQ